ncbi:metalloregulator ArsR/SmtB family transcription factor [Desulfobacterales bacterium HSG16]|nr:metalloregulator ArsR/SmtB family transcription factor [Desulfobacterales bacterium HSG16]
MSDDVCQSLCIHKSLIEKVKAKMLPSGQLFELSEMFKILGDHTRIRILSALSISELCVCDLSDLLDMKQPAISHQLRILRNARLVKYRKEGKNAYYSLDDHHINELVKIGMMHVREG